jgi:hypothetical protein
MGHGHGVGIGKPEFGFRVRARESVVETAADLMIKGLDDKAAAQPASGKRLGEYCWPFREMT